ncbi:MAG: GTP-binding protein [Thermoplasmata archaeon]|nr:GTP-binding protein [Thermoplasmata archaeon]
MPSLEEQIVAIEDEIRRTHYNKATSGHIGRLRARIAFLRLEREKRSRGKGGGVGYSVRKSGNATVALVGYPSTGKSTLLTHLTGANSQSAAYDFTTVSIIPGMLEAAGASIQILDMPGLVPGASRGRGRGREVLSVVRSADLILFLTDKEHADFRGLRDELEDSGIRVNARRPRVVVTVGTRGGLTVSSTVKLTRLDEDSATGIAREFGLHNGAVVFREDATAEQLIDVLAGNRVYVPAILVVNKSDLLSPSDRERLRDLAKPFVPIFIAAETGQNLDELVLAIVRALAFIRVYLRPPGGEADRVEPMILRGGSRVNDLLARLPPELGRNFRSALVWGRSARFPGQTVGREHLLADEDVVTVVVQRGRTAAG